MFLCAHAAVIYADLVDPPAGTHQVVLGVDDELQQPHWRERLKMPRSDLAALAVQALLLKGEGTVGLKICPGCFSCVPVCYYR